MKKKRVLITGITGQDGAYLTEELLAAGKEVHGLVRRMACLNTQARIARLKNSVQSSSLHLHSGSIENYTSLYRIIQKIQPDECYHLAAQSFVQDSFQAPFETLRINIDGTHNLFDVLLSIVPQCRIYFAASSEMFGQTSVSPQNEETLFSPCSPYAISKVAGYHLAHYFRQSHNMFIACGILFNHESPFRGEEFVTRKITRGVAAIKRGLQTTSLQLGNLQAKRDWGYAKEYVSAMRLMLARSAPDDFVIATGKQHTVEDFVATAFSYVGLDYRNHIEIDSSLFRPTDVFSLCGDATKAKRVLGWSPQCSFEELVGLMVQASLDELSVM